MSIEEIENASSETIDGLWQCITTIEAQEQLRQFEVQDWARMKSGKREKRHKELFALAHPGEMKPKNFVSPEQVQALLGSLNG